LRVQKGNLLKTSSKSPVAVTHSLLSLVSLRKTRISIILEEEYGYALKKIKICFKYTIQERSGAFLVHLKRNPVLNNQTPESGRR